LQLSASRVMGWARGWFYPLPLSGTG
jgi:hypothetical protein